MLCSLLCSLLRHAVLCVQRWSGVVRMGAVVGGGQEGEEDEELRQTKEQAAARRRWETLVRFIHSPLLGVSCLLIIFALFPCGN